MVRDFGVVPKIKRMLYMSLGDKISDYTQYKKYEPCITPCCDYWRRRSVR